MVGGLQNSGLVHSDPYADGMCVHACWILSGFLGPPWNAACQAPLSMGFPRQEYWSGVAISSTQGLNLVSWVSCTAGRILTTEPSGKPKRWYSSAYSCVPISASLRYVISVCRLVCKRQNLRKSEVFCFCATVWVCMCVCVSERDTEKKLFLVRSGVFLQRLKVSDVKGWPVLKC